MQGAHPHAGRSEGEGRVEAVQMEGEGAVAAEDEGAVAQVALVTLVADRRVGERLQIVGVGGVELALVLFADRRVEVPSLSRL